MTSPASQIKIVLPSNVDIDDDFIMKVKRLFDVDIKFSIEDMTEEEQKLGIRFELFGNLNNVNKARNFINAAKGNSEATTSLIFELADNVSILPEAIERIEVLSSACLFPSLSEIVIIATEENDGAIAISLLEEESSKNFKNSTILLDNNDIIIENVQKLSDDEEFVVYDLKTFENQKLVKMASNEGIDKVKKQIYPINKRLENMELDQLIHNNFSLASTSSNYKESYISKISDLDDFDKVFLPKRFLSPSESPPSKFHIKDQHSNKDCLNTTKSSVPYYSTNISSTSTITSEIDKDSELVNQSYNLYGNLQNRIAIMPSNESCISSDEESMNGGKKNEGTIGKNFNETDLRYIVIDGSNVAMTHGKHIKFSCKGIKIAVNYFLGRGHRQITVIVPQARRKTSDHSTLNPEILEKLYKKNYLLFSPTREINGRSISSYDDRYILDIACKEQAVVVSNDNYRDLYKEQRPDYNKVIEERILTYVFHGDDFMPPLDPLGKLGPNLEDFLRHKIFSFTDQIPQNNNNVLKRKKNKGCVNTFANNNLQSYGVSYMQKRKKYRLRLCVDPTALRSWIVH